MTEDAPATRRELDALASRMDRTDARLESMDTNGTRGVSVLQSQMLGIVRDMTELKADLNQRFALHERVHEQDEASRRAARRWAWGFAVAAGGTLAATLAVVLDIASRVH